MTSSKFHATFKQQYSTWGNNRSLKQNLVIRQVQIFPRFLDLLDDCENSAFTIWKSFKAIQTVSMSNS